MKVIGLTGGVGTGKSEVTEILKEKYQAYIIQSDKLGHLAMEMGSESYRRIITLFGDEILDETKEINRKKLGDVVFADESKLAALNEIIHPFVKQKIREKILQAEKNGAPFVVLESAILLESGLNDFCNEIWLVTATNEIRFERLAASRGYTKEKMEAIMEQQLSEKEMKKHASRVIVNNGSKEELISTLAQQFPLC